ncbi:MAG: hypothetical protein AB7V20_09220 [Phycisphaerales bacterium]
MRHLLTNLTLLLLSSTSLSQQSPPPPQSPGETVARLQAESAALLPLLESDLAKSFARATSSLPHISPRTIYRDKATRDCFTPDEITKLPPEAKANLAELTLDEAFYYTTRYGSPLAYARPLDILAAHNLPAPANLHILDFGHGTIGHLRLLASLGAHTLGVEVDPILKALYSQPSDTGLIPRADSNDAERAAAGSITLIQGRWPADPDTIQAVNDAIPPASLDLFISKNTLKRGYIHPDPERSKDIDPRRLINLAVDDLTYCRAVADLTYCRAVADLLKPGALFMIYNLSPAQAPPDKPYIPWADGRSPFSRETLEQAGFEIIAFDHDDSVPARAMAHALNWDAPNDQGHPSMNLESDLFAHYTLCRKKAQ